MIKRFYKDVSLSNTNNGHQILLDGKPLNTPLKNVLTINNAALAQTICDEWASQGDAIIPASMPVYSILVTATDKSSDSDKNAIINELTPYIDGDLVFYHAPDPIGLTQYQANIWGKAIDEFENLYKIRPIITHDLTALRQSSKYHDVMLQFMNGLSDIEFTIFHILVSACGSPLVACLAIHNIVDADEIIKIMNAESDFYHKHYKFKDDDISPDERRKNELLQRDITACMTILEV